MDSKVTVKEIIFIIGIIVSFLITALFIMMGYEKYALLSLCVAAACVLFEFCVMTSDNSSRIIDLSSAALRMEHVAKNKDKFKARKRDAMANKETDMGYSSENVSDDGTFYESVSNLRVYKPGEKIELHNSDDEKK